MSYDLFFRCPEGATPPSRDDLLAYFKGRERYNLSDAQADYHNEDTGVYFHFSVLERETDSEPEEEDRPDDGLSVPLAFNMNYFRPHPFGLEAEPELSALVQEFDLTVDDPQNDGMGRGKYSRDGFLRGWNAGNRFAISAITHMKGPDTTPALLPAQQLENAWRWNFSRREVQEDMEYDVFFPQIMFIRRPQRVATVIVWGDAIPILLPKVDLIILGRKQIIGDTDAESLNMALVTWDEFAALKLRPNPKWKAPEQFLFTHDKPPPTLVNFFRARAAISEKLEGVAFDQIIDSELVEEAVKTAKGKK